MASHSEEFNRSEFSGDIDLTVLHAECVADGTVGPLFSHVHIMGDVVVLHFTDDVASRDVQPLVDAHESTPTPFDPHVDPHAEV